MSTMLTYTNATPSALFGKKRLWTFLFASFFLVSGLLANPGTATAATNTGCDADIVHTVTPVSGTSYTIDVSGQVRGCTGGRFKNLIVDSSADLGSITRVFDSFANTWRAFSTGGNSSDADLQRGQIDPAFGCGSNSLSSFGRAENVFPGSSFSFRLVKACNGLETINADTFPWGNYAIRIQSEFRGEYLCKWTVTSNPPQCDPNSPQYSKSACAALGGEEGKTTVVTPNQEWRVFSVPHVRTVYCFQRPHVDEQFYYDSSCVPVTYDEHVVSLTCPGNESPSGTGPAILVPLGGGGTVTTSVTPVPPSANPLAVSGTCSASPASFSVGGTATWSVPTATGASGTYTYTWSGHSEVSGKVGQQIVSDAYTSAGTKTAIVTITSGTQSLTRTCDLSVSSQPDLTAGVSVTKTNPTPGETITLSGSVSNTGSGSSSATFSNNYYYNDNGGAYAYFASGGSVTGIDASGGPNATKAAGTFSWAVGAVDGHTYGFRLCADNPSNGVVETNESNNCSSSVFVTVTAPAPAPLSASCAKVTTTNVPGIAEAVTWQASGVSGGTAPYTYAWTGPEQTGSVSGSSYTKSYSAVGLKRPTLVVSSTDGQSVTVGNCPSVTVSPVLTVVVGTSGSVNSVNYSTFNSSGETFDGKISCGSSATCSYKYTPNESVGLVAALSGGFSGSFSGCDSTPSTNRCALSMNTNRTVTLTTSMPEQITVVLSGPSSVTYGTAPALSWTTTGGPTTCTASGGWSGSKTTSASNGPQTQSAITSATTYTITCTKSGVSSATDSVTVQVSPTAPTISVSTGASCGGSMQIALTQASSGATGYKLYRYSSANASAGWSQIPNSSTVLSAANFPYQDTNLLKGSQYKYQVEAVGAGPSAWTIVDAAGTYSLSSAPCQVNRPVLDITTGSCVPSGSSTGTITLSWTAPTVDATHAAAVSYDVYENNIQVSPVGGTSSLSLTRSNRLGGSSYNYKVIAKSADGVVAPDAVITASVPVCVPSADLKIRKASIGSYTDGPLSINYGEAVDLTWTSSNVTSCSASWTSQTGTSGTVSNAGPLSSASYSYSITCTGPSGSASDSVSISVGAPTVSCSSSLSGTTGTWTAVPLPTLPSGLSYSYVWSGTDMPTPATANPLVVSYPSSGTKTGSVTLSATGGRTASATCSPNLSVMVKPDLWPTDVPVISGLRNDDNTIISGTSFTLRARPGNIGGAFSSPDFRVKFQGKLHSQADTSYVDLPNLATVSGGLSSGTPGNPSIVGTAAQISHTSGATDTNTWDFRYCADLPTNVIDESNEGNNCSGASSVTFGLPPVVPVPTGSLSCNANSSSQITLTWSQLNGTNVSLFRGSSLMSTLTGLSGSVSDTGLTPSTSYTYYLRNGATTGSSQLATATCVTLAVQKPDLIVSVNPTVDQGSTLSVGQSLTFSATVRNQGTVSTGGTNFYNRFQLINQANSSVTTVANSPVVTADVSVGSTQSVRSGSWTAVAGTYRLVACADTDDVNGHDDRIDESSETNNCSPSDASGSTFTVAKPNLTPSDTPVISGLRNDDNTLISGTAFTLRAKPANVAGGFVGPAFVVKFQGKLHSQGDTSYIDLPNTTTVSGGLSAGTPSSPTVVGTAAQISHTSGATDTNTWDFRYCADLPTNVIDESNENDNCSGASTVTFAPAPVTPPSGTLSCTADSSTQITLTWSQANGTSVSLFRGSALMQTVVGGSGTVINNGLTPSTSHTYYLRNGATTGSSQLATATCATPVTPTASTVTLLARKSGTANAFVAGPITIASGESIDLQWVVGNNPTSCVASSNPQTPQTTAQWATAKNAAGGTQTGLGPLTAGESYGIQCFKAGTPDSAVSYVVVSIGASVPVPATPVVDAQTGSCSTPGAITLSYSQPSTGGATTNYELSRSPFSTSDAGWGVIETKTTLSALRAVDGGLTPGGNYNYQLRAVGSAGEANSAIDSATASVPCPAASVDLRGNTLDAVSVTTGATLTLTWTSSNVAANSCTSTAVPSSASWTGGGKPSQNSTGVSFSAPSTAGTYTYTITCNSSFGGTVTDSVPVTVSSPAPTPLSASCSVSAPGQTDPNQTVQVDLKNNVNVTWSASASGGTAPYTYTWSGNDPLLAGRTGSSVTFMYTTIGSRKDGQITVRDSAGVPVTVGPTNCSNWVTVVDTTCTSNCTPGDFALNVAPTATINFVGDVATSSKVAIYVLANSFVDAVTLSSAPGTIAGIPVRYTFYNHGTSVINNILTSGTYLSGLDVVVSASRPIPAGHYQDVITITGASTKTHTATVSLDVNVVTTTFEEF